MPTAQDMFNAYDLQKRLEANQGPLVNLEEGVIAPIEYHTGQNLDYISKYDEGISYQQATSQGGFQRRRHESQPWYASLGNSLNQAIIGSIVGQTLEGTGYLLDLPQYIDLAKGTEKEFGNFLSDIGKDLNTWTQKATPIYDDPNKQGEFSPEDWSWWMKNLPSVASTLSLMIPAAGAVKGISMIGNALNIGSKLGKAATWAATGIGQAVVSRHMENLMESGSVAEELKNLEGTKIDQAQYDKLSKNYGLSLIPENIDGKNYYTINSNAAQEIAAKAAANTYKANWAMLVQDIPQYLLLNTSFGKATEKLTAGIAKKLGQSYVPTLASGLTAGVSDAVGEGGEEAYQFVVGERFKELAMADAGLVDRRDLSDALKDYTKQGDFWTSAFFGAIGAGVMQTAGKPLNRMINRVKGIESEDERRMKDLDQWKDRVQTFNKHMVVAEMLDNPHLYKTMRDQLSTEMGVKAAENGNLDYMIQTINAISNATEQDMSILGITQEDVQAAKEYNPNLISDLKRTGEIYQKNLNTHGKQFASPLTINERNLEFLDKDIREFKTASDQLYTSVPNIDKLSPEGSELIKLKSQVDNFKEIRKSLVKNLKENKNSDIKTSIQSRIDELDRKASNLSAIYNEAVKSYPVESKDSDSKTEYKSKEFDAYQKTLLSLQYKEEHRSSLKNDLDELRTYKGQEKYFAIQRRNAEAALKEAAVKAKTAEEVSNVADAAKGTEFEKSTKKTIDEQANIQAMNNKATADIFSVKEETDAAQNVIGKQNEEALHESVNEKTTAFEKRYIDDKGKVNSHLYFSDYTKIKALINGIKEDLNQIMQFNTLVNGNNPKSLVEFVGKMFSQRDIYNNPNAQIIIDLLHNYFIASAEGSVFINGQAKQAAKEAEVIDSSTDLHIATEEEPRFYKNANEGRVIIATANNNIPIATHYLKEDKLVSLLNPNEIDYKFLESFGVPSGSTLHIELNEIDEGYNPKQARDKFNAYNRRYRLVYYIDGNTNNKHVTNRKVIGLLPSYKPVGVNDKTAKAMADIKIIRDMLIKQFPINLDKDIKAKNSKINSGITVKAAGYSMKYTQSKDYNSPIAILKNHVSTLLKQGSISKELAADIESVGGYYLGYVNDSGNIIFSNTSLANIDLKTVKDNGVSRSGEMFVAVPNPARPTEMSLIRVFKKNMRDLVKTMPEFVKERKSDAMELIETDLKAQKASAKGISTITMNKIKSDLAFTSNGSKFLLQTLTLEDLQNKESDGYKQLQGTLEDAWLNFNKKNINTRNFTATFGSTVEEGPFNKVMDKYLGGNIQEGKIFENVQVMMDTTPLTKESIAKTKTEVKEIKKVVAENKEVLQPSIEKGATVEVGTSKQVEITKQDKGVTTTTKRTAFNVKNDTGIPTNPEALASKMAPKADPNDEDEKYNSTGLKFKVEQLNKSKERMSPEDELKWFKSKLPHVDVNDLKEIQKLLNEVVKGGYEAVGAMYNAAIYLNSDITSGTVFHEAFHVLFNYSLSDKDRERFTKDIPGKTIIDKEEYLADQFADYLVSDQADKTIVGAIRKIFRQLKALIKALVGANVTSVRELADRADLGFYKKISSATFEDTTLRTKVENWSFEKTREGAETIANHIMIDLIPGIRKSDPELSLKTDVEILQLYTTKETPDKIFRAAYLSLTEMYDQMLEVDENDSRLDLLYELVTNLYRDNNTEGELVGETIRVLANNHGIYISRDKVESTVSESDQEEDLVEGAEEEYKENWQIKERSAKDNAPTRIKDFVRYMETGEYNSFGMPKYVEYDDTYNSLLSDLEGSKSVEDIMFNLQEGLLFHPEYQQIIEQMKDKSFATDMLQAFSRDLYSYTIVVNKNGQYIVTESNRRGVANTIISNWTSGVMQSSLVSIDKAGNTFIDIKRTVELKESFDSLVNTIIKSKDVDSSVFQEFSNITKELGFEIAPKVFEYVQTLKPKYRREFYLGTNSLNQILDKFAKGLNPFDIESADDTNNIKGESNSIKAIARIVKKASPELFENSFFDVSGNRVYAHNVPTYLSSFINQVTNPNKIQEYLNSRMKDHFFNSGVDGVPSNYILKKLDNAKTDENALREALTISFVDGLSEPGNKLSYPDMTYADLQVLSLAAYYNNANSKYSMFRMPVFSDAGRMAMVRVERPEKTSVALSELVNLAEKEYVRITTLQKNDGGIFNYGSTDNKDLNKGFSILPMLNGKVTKSPVADRVNITKILDSYFTELSETYYNNLINNKVLVTKGKGFDLDKSRVDNRILTNRTNEQFKEFIKEFMINDFLVRSSMSLLTVGDPAFYESKEGSVTIDYTKRAKEIMSPKLVPDTSASYTEYNAKGEAVETIQVSAEYKSIYLEDAEIGAPNSEVIFNAIKSLEDDGTISHSKAKQLRVAYKGIINQTDGQAYTTLPFYRETMISFGRWKDKHQAAYNRLEKRLGTANDIALMLQPIKPFVFSQIYNSILKRFVPVQHKNSEYVLLPQLVGKNPKLKKLYDYMVENGVGVANFNSAVKVGGFGSVNLDELGKESTNLVNTTIKGINIYSKSSDILGKRLTNPNWYAKDLMDVETPYKANASKIKASHLNAEDALRYDMTLMYKLQVQKFRKNPELIDEINESGGLQFILNSEHSVGVKNSRWEGRGIESNFIKVLSQSYTTVAKELNKFQSADQVVTINQPIQHLIPTIDRGIQQETPEHVVDTENLFGTQIRKLIMSDLFEGTTYYGGKSSDELYKLYEDLIIQDLKEAYESVESKFLDESGEINYQKLHDILVDEARKRSKGDEFEKAIELVERNDGTRRTQLPLFHPLFANTTESLITSIFRNKVTKQKINGAAVVQVSNFGLSKELKLVFDTEENQVDFDNKINIGFQGYKGGFENVGKGTPQGDGKDKAMRSIATTSIVEVVDRSKQSSSYTTEKVLPWDTNNTIDGIVMLARNSELKGQSLDNETKSRINEANERGAEFIVGDMPNVDSQFIDYLQEIGAKFTIYHTGKESRINIDIPSLNESKGLLYAEIMLPAWSKEFFKDFLDEDGNVDFEMAERGMPEEIFEMIGYRIPTEDKYSMLPLKVIGFLPFESGGSIMLPAEITTISGSDFDIDKMYLMMKSFKRDSFGNYEVVKYYEDKGVAGNNKAARDNMKIDLMTSVLRNKHTLEAMLTPGGYEYNREVAGMIMDKLGIKSSLSGLFDVLTQDEMAIRNMTGRKLVGIAANHNAHHALRQHYNLGLSGAVKFDSDEYSNFGGRKALSQFKYEDGKLTKSEDIDRTISRNLSEFLAAVVDNAKDPLASFMNYNTITADVISMIIGLGIDTHTAILFINQPIIREVIEAQKAEPTKYITSIIKKVAKKYKLDLRQEVSNLNTEELLVNVNGSTQGYQKSVLVAFNKYQKYAKDLGDVIRASTADTRGLGASIAHGESITKLQDKILTKGSTITGVEDLFNETDKHNFVSDFTKYGITNPIEKVLNKIYPYNNQLFTSIKESINDQLTFRNLSPEERNYINRNIVSFLLSRFEFFEVGSRDEIVNSIPKRLVELRVKYPDEFKSPAYLPLTGRLNFETKSDRVPIDVISFNNVGKLSEGQRVRIQQAWADMLSPSKTPNAEIREFAEDLVRYSYYTSGLNFTPNGFSHMIPVDAYISLIKDSKGLNVSDVLYNELDAYNALSGVTTEVFDATNTFLNQFYRNNYTNPVYVPRLNEDRSNFTTKSEHRITVNPNEVTDDSLYITEYYAETKVHTGKRFIAEKDGNRVKLYTFVRSDANGVLIYERTAPLGIPNYITEYNRNGGTFMESSISSNNETINKTKNNIANNKANASQLDEALNSKPKINTIPNNEDLDELEKVCPMGSI